jgi:ribosomal protein S3
MEYFMSHKIKSSFYEKNKEESTLLTYQQLLINKYLRQILFQRGMISQKLIYQINDKFLNIIVYYYNLNHLTEQSKEEHIPLMAFKLRKMQINSYKKNNIQKKKQQLNKLFRKRYITLSELINKPEVKKILHRKNEKIFNLHRFKNILLIKQYKMYYNKLKYKTRNLLKAHYYHEYILETLSKFTKKKYHISLTFKNLNKGISTRLTDKELDFLKQQSIQFKQHVRKNYFIDSMNICIIGSKFAQSSYLFSTFIANHLKYLKYHKPFVFFFKQLLKTIISSKIFVLNGIKILISGRLNNKPRAKSMNIIIGKIPTVTKDVENIDYSESTCFTKNGTLGIKVWCSHLQI